MKIIDLKNALVAGASCYSTLHFLEEGRKLKISFIAGVLSASVISLKNDNTENNTSTDGKLKISYVDGVFKNDIMSNQRDTTNSETTEAALLGIIAGLLASATSGKQNTAGSTAARSTIFALVTGYYSDEMTFFNSNTTSSITLKTPVNGSQDVFIAKIDGDGNWIWVVDAGSTLSDSGYGITSMYDNTALVTGFYNGAMTFYNSNTTGSIALKAPVQLTGGGSSQDVFVAKINGDGTWLWAVDAGSSTSDAGYSITAMGDNTALVMGVYRGAMTFYNSNTTQSTLTLKAPVGGSNVQDVFIAKIDANGTWIWAVDAGSTSYDEGVSITAMCDNTALVMGIYNEQMTFFNSNTTQSGITLKTPVGSTDVFIAKINGDGTWLWAVDAGSSTSDSGYGITAMCDNTALVTGVYSGEMTFFNSNTTQSTLTLKAPVQLTGGGNSVDVFVAKIDANGNWIWAVDAGSSDEDDGLSITAMCDNTALVMGIYKGAMMFFNFNTQSTITLKAPVQLTGGGSSYDIFIAKIDANGNWIWAVDAGSNAIDGGACSITAMCDNTALVTGSYNGQMTFFNSNTTQSGITLKTPVGSADVFIAKINANGTWLWAVDAGSTTYDEGYSIAALGDNTALVTGYYSGEMTFFNSNTTQSSITLKQSSTGEDVFIAKIDANGTWIWAVDAGSTGTDKGLSITAFR